MCVCVCLSLSIYIERERERKREREKERERHTHTMEYYSAIKKNEILPFATTRMDLDGIMLSEISQTEKYKYCTISLIRGI